MKIKLGRIGALAVALTSLIAANTMAQADTLTINTDRSSPGQRTALTEIVEEFKAENPGIEVNVNFSDVESYKTSIRNFLVTRPPDVAFWFTGMRMRAFTERGLFEDLTEFIDENGLREPMSPFLSTVTADGKQWMLPTTFSSYGVFYNQSIFADAGVEPPSTWDEMMEVAEKIKAMGVTPFAVGSRDLWANALWFDFLNRRINGLEFHNDLMEGRASYTDPRVVKVMDTWRIPIEKGYFVENASSFGWQDALPFLPQGRAAMYVMGPFLRTMLPPEAVEDIGFFPFPVFDAEVGLYEMAPMNGVGIPSGAENKELAKRFLAFFAQPEHMASFAKGGSEVPARSDIEIPDTEFAATLLEMVASSKGISQFYDRDTDPEMAQIGMNGFQEFLANPDRQDQILERLEQARQRIFN